LYKKCANLLIGIAEQTKDDNEEFTKTLKLKIQALLMTVSLRYIFNSDI
jgi:hypothetical protein